jgi:hypothetical protein
MHELKISLKARQEVNHALICIDEIVGNDIAVTIILHDKTGGIFTLTDGHADDLEIRFTDDLLNLPTK